ncbi:hypothetical protein P3X46_033967 [Hevea brasiliensis]|uniref:S1 motif domain-containing protein n=1 Tax=Hevea brasiliensis TaxID=3981 RepID=A0ABQ9K9E8_HEVBR|nr:hypothetical protein P3X46_033967 [Hevea brasiliensis]
MKDSKRKLVLIDEDEQHDDGVQVMDRKGENVILEDEDEEDDEDDLDEFENDGFIVDDEEEEEGEQGGKDRQKRKKKKKGKLVKDVILDDDDFELLRENKISGVVHSYNVGNEKFKRLKKAESSKNTADFGFSDDDASLYDGDNAEEEEAVSSDKDDEMADFIVFDELGDKKGVPRQQRLRENKPQQVTLASSLEEAGCTFGNTDQILKRHLVKIVKPDDFNEFELDNYTTTRDYSIIKENDVPERMQIFEEISGPAGPAPVDEMSRDQESSWILNQLAANIHILLCKKKAQEESVMKIDLLEKINKEDIMRFLELRHLEKYDILWAVNELDKKWLLLQKRKNALETCYNKRYEEESCTASDVVKFRWLEQQFDTIMKSLKLAETETDINDLDMKFMLHFPPPEEGVVSKFKLPKRRSEYSNCSKAGLWKLARKFGCSSEQFGLHLTLEKVGMEFWEDPVESPDVMASDFTCPMFETPEAVLNGARFMAAMEISCEPCVRKHVRRIFMDKAVVSTCPTQEGDKTIDSFHLFYGVKWLRDKPLDQFQEAQWLLILKAEEEKLLQVTINLPENVMNKLVTDSQEIYLTGSSHGSARLWDEQRKLIIQEAFLKVLLPSLEKEARALLITRAKSWLLMEYGKQLWNRVSIAPYQQKEYAAGQEEGIAPRVVACCWGPGKPPITFVMLNSSGQLLDVLETRSLSLRSQDVIDQQRKKYDQQRVFKFILNHRPNVIVLGAANVCCTWLKDDIEEIILQVEENTTDIGQMIDKINIVYGDESFAQLYENSKISSSQLPGQQGIVRRAVALGRYLQNPLAMIATLCGPQKDIVSWKLNSLEHFLTPVEKYDMIEMVLVDVTNQVGMDVTFTMSHDWLLAPLQFVSGLGPQTAAFLHRDLIGGKMVNNRYDLADCGLTSKKIFYNAVGFLRVRGNQLLSATNEFGLLDDTRIHPESYGLAESLSKAVHNDVAQTQPLTYIKNNPQLLNDFDIDDYADNYAIEQGENKRETLHDIKNELLHGFLDPRKPYEKPTKDELFFLISGKNEDAFAEGRIIQVTVRRVLSQRAFCALDFGLTGVIMKDDFLDGTDDFSLTDKLHEGDVVTCKIKQLEKSRFQVLLTCKESELKSCRYQTFREIDPYYHEGKNKLLRQQGEACKNDLAKKQSKQRTINHPRFKNITGDEAMEVC